jgi:hypothetical protein
MTTSLDDLFAQIDEVATSLEKAQQTQGKKKPTDQNFKNLDMVFLATQMGTYELKLFTDSDGKIHEEVFLHTVKTATAKVTVPCKGENCTVCALQQKLDGMKNKAAWKFKAYKVNKILVKIGDSQVKTLKAGTVYVAYVDDGYFKPLIESIRTNKKYYPEDLAKMLKATENSAGMVVSATRGAKKTSFNFNFVQPLKIEAVNETEVFGGKSYKLVNQGYFRTNYVDPNKLKTAEGIIQKLILATAEAAAKKAGTHVPEPSKTADPLPETKVDSPPTDAPGIIKTVSVDTSVKDPKALDASGKPVCFGYFDPNNDICSTQCQHKRNCLMDAMEHERI